jgi:NADH:ubiquinone oxidoreductase subunit F (NADH-binding)
MLKANIIINKISNAGLVGRGGASYPTASKWSAVKKALAGKKIGYIIANGAEGEPGLKKDAYILNHHPEEVLDGLFLADQFLGPAKIRKIYIFLNRHAYDDSALKLKKVLEAKKFSLLRSKIEFFIKPENLSYISGEETAICNLLEGKKAEPRLKPPYPTEHGVHGAPTLINNIETLYNVSLACQGQYHEKRFYTVTGAVKHPGVYDLSAHLMIEEVLRQTNNLPKEPFFVQIGGEASGEVLDDSQLERPVEGAGSIMVYDKKKTNHDKLLKYWLKFYKEQSCGQCAVCREGTYRLEEIVDAKSFDKKLFWEIVDSLAETSFCALGSSLPIPLKSYFNNILKN